MKQIEAGDLVVIVPAELEVKVSKVRAQPGPSYFQGTVLKASWNEEMIREAHAREYVAVHSYEGKYAVVVSVDVGNYALLAVEGELVHMHTHNLQLPIEFEITV